MPIYEYRCEACGHELESIQRMSDAPLLECPVCGKPALKKQISAAGFRLAGGGWYETDFKKDNKRNIAGEPAAKPAAKSSDTKSSDTKPVASA
ncbi:transcriptional regulator [Acidihalobacter yilgarnensis]|uniref:Transcriptional regulator n=1 Tax=Acidihalobacter yilgarnensis TaxID=2819280 RepID=A0A1D8IR70_9GAMM|nr:zinc ribbon domain-containing protein [Acidihalobacter yilgarnensis]AOU98966.1 transcriptional regulator [Acidihalobacter yilgarnensis]